ncbi:hypothetical protein [Prosthecobacter sp.]|uniref:hypothetical protein n=1 Tax=Prosthecobacter sp. TaxID=1965333 RepID=UPI003783DDBA
MTFKGLCKSVFLGFILSLDSSPCLALPPAVCEHVVFHGDRNFLMVAQAFYGLAFESQFTPEEEKKVLLNLTSMVKKFRIRRLGTGEEFEIERIINSLQRAAYHIQMMPVLIKGKRVLMLHLLAAEVGVDNWRKTYFTIFDGGTASCRVFVDLTTFKVMLINCNGYG